MSAGIAHEINDPLAIIAGSIGLLSKFKDNPEKLAAKVAAIEKSCDRIARMYPPHKPHLEYSVL